MWGRPVCLPEAHLHTLSTCSYYHSGRYWRDFIQGPSGTEGTLYRDHFVNAPSQWERRRYIVTSSLSLAGRIHKMIPVYKSLSILSVSGHFIDNFDLFLFITIQVTVGDLKFQSLYMIFHHLFNIFICIYSHHRNERCLRFFSHKLSCDFLKKIVEEIKSIIGARAVRSSPSWVCIPQQSLAIACDFWKTNSLR